jgi:hypothetical protein
MYFTYQVNFQFGEVGYSAAKKMYYNETPARPFRWTEHDHASGMRTRGAGRSGNRWNGIRCITD